MFPVTGWGKSSLFFEKLYEVIGVLKSAFCSDFLYRLGCKLEQADTALYTLLIDVFCEGTAYLFMK